MAAAAAAIDDAVGLGDEPPPPFGLLPPPFTFVYCAVLFNFNITHTKKRK